MKKAFSLLELSIVLVIIGLIVGGIVAGASMIRAAELRSVITEMQATETAINTFRDKYLGLPGDLRNATAFWGAADGGDGIGADCMVIESTGSETCDGDSNGQINNQTTTANERLRAWQHLANAELISGSFTGALNTGGNLEVGINSPEPKLSGGTYEMHYQGSSIFGQTGHFIKLAGVTGRGANNAVLSPVEAHTLDAKMDDGNADSGNVFSIDSSDVVGCVTGGTALVAPSEYILTNEEPSCRFYKWLD